MHVDFLRVDPNKSVHMKVPLHFKNGELAPGVKLSGGNITHILNEVEVICLPKDLPEFIEVDLSSLTAGQTLHLSEVTTIPAGVEFLALARGADQPIAACVVPRGMAEEETAAPAEGAAAPAAAT